MSKVRIELNSPGIRALLRSPEMQAVLKDRADTVKDRCGDGYESYVAPTRAVAVVETASRKAYDDNSANNTLLKAVSGSRSGATVHEHKRRLKDGRIITVRSYQRNTKERGTDYERTHLQRTHHLCRHHCPHRLPAAGPDQSAGHT